MQTPKEYKSAPPQPAVGNKSHRKLKMQILNVIVVLLGSFFIGQLLINQFSTLSIILVAVLSAVLIVSLVFGLKKHKRAKLFGIIAIVFTVFTMVFSALGFYFTHFSGPVVPQVSYPNTLNTPLTTHLQTLQQSAGFQFLEAEHFGTVTFTALTIHSTFSNAPQGGIDWDFYAKDTNSRLMVGQSSGKPYNYIAMGYVKGQPLPGYYPSGEQTTEAFSKFDSLGLHWFYDQAVSEYHKATGYDANATALTLEIIYDDAGDYSGLVLVITGTIESHDNFGNKVYPMVFKYEFEPNGVVLSANNYPP
jgi:hypothetical protein